MPLVIPSFATGILGWLVDRYGGRWFATAGFVIFTPFEILLRFVTHDTLSQKVLLCTLLAFIGVTMDLIVAPTTAEIMHVVASKEREKPGLFGEIGAYAQVKLRDANVNSSNNIPVGLRSLQFRLGCWVFDWTCKWWPNSGTTTLISLILSQIWAGYVNERAGWGTMTWTLALLSIVTAIPTALWCGGYAFKTRRPRHDNGERTKNDDKRV